MLFVNTNLLGMKVQAACIRAATAERQDVDAVHVDIERPLWVKAVAGSYRLPFGIDFSAYRYLQVYRAIIGQWLRGPLDIYRFDLVHFLTQGIALCVTDARVTARAAVVVNVDSTAALEGNELGACRFVQKPFINAEARMFQKADLVACYSSWAARSVREDYDVESERITVVRNGVDLPSGAATHSHAGMPRLVFIGNAWKRKGGEDLLAAHQLRFADRAELHIFSAAPRPPGTFRNLVWHGSVEHRRLTHEILPSMDIFVLPSRLDMSPWAILEAAAAGLPVISTRLAGIPEMVIDGETGILVAPGDNEALAKAIDELLASPILRKQMGAKARERVLRHFNRDIVYPQYIDRLVGLALRARRLSAEDGVGSSQQAGGPHGG
jgi:glycosyltransferase involved in cell wall biosynthesis